VKRLFVGGFVLLLIAAAVGGATLGSTAGVRALTKLVESVRPIDDRPVSSDPTPVAFAVRPGATASSIGQDLMRAGLIRSATAFRLQVELRDAGRHLAVGEYELRRNMTIEEVLDILTAGPTGKGNLVTIPEGWRAEEVAKYLEARGIVEGSAFLDAVAGRDPSIDLPLPEGASTFEGYLFPDTYDFGRQPTPRSVLTTFLQDFNRRVTDSLVAKAEARGMTAHELITLASIVEREATEPDERAEIAAVFRNRMAQGMPLQADPTVQYARIPFGTLSADVFWATVLTRDDLQIQSRYNTYQVRGLPPAPICNPGLAAIQAAAEPADRPWLYFVAKGDGSHLFARTLDEHNQNVARVRATPGR
jgi:UPF0755 protein